VHSVQLILAIIIVREDSRSADQDEDEDKPGNKKDTQRQTIDTQHQKLKPHETMSSTYANILKYHIQGMPTNIILQVFI
jgi:hypothetical protein